WPSRECSTAGGQSALQSTWVLFDRNHRQWPDASAGSFQGGTGGGEHAWGNKRHIPSAKLLSCGQRGTSPIGSDPGTRDAPNVRDTPKEGRVRCPLFTNSPNARV